MPTWKIIGMAIAWAFAAGFIAVVTAIYTVLGGLRAVMIRQVGDGHTGPPAGASGRQVFLAAVVAVGGGVE